MNVCIIQLDANPYLPMRFTGSAWCQFLVRMLFPLQWVSDMADAGADQYTFHLEATGTVWVSHPLGVYIQSKMHTYLFLTIKILIFRQTHGSHKSNQSSWNEGAVDFLYVKKYSLGLGGGLHFQLLSISCHICNMKHSFTITLMHNMLSCISQPSSHLAIASQSSLTESKRGHVLHLPIMSDWFSQFKARLKSNSKCQWTLPSGPSNHVDFCFCQASVMQTIQDTYHDDMLILIQLFGITLQPVFTLWIPCGTRLA